MSPEKSKERPVQGERSQEKALKGLSKEKYFVLLFFFFCFSLTHSSLASSGKRKGRERSQNL
jgi:hypothetical protein